jgi:hypothetical protein
MTRVLASELIALLLVALALCLAARLVGSMSLRRSPPEPEREP